MKIYLDIDGTMIHEELGSRWGQAAAGMEEFIQALRPYDTYWLTTHCRDGNPEAARNMLKQHLPEALHHDIDRIKGTVWDEMKTEAIDWQSDFIWFDNDIFPEEWTALEQCRKNQSVVQVDLINQPNQLLEIIETIL